MATDGNTWKDGLTGAPIVYNTSAPNYGASSGGGPKQGLAGGNFYWVATAGGNDPTKGHNVWGISGVDPNLARAPGHVSGCVNSCHWSLAYDPATTEPPHHTPYQWDVHKNGCEGCHYSVKHHKDDGGYRMLYSYEQDNVSKAVRGIEDPNWEVNPTSSTHNTYIAKQGIGNNYLGDGYGNISSYCAGCHWYFHDLWGPLGSGPIEGPQVSPWFRHPTDVVLPNSGEYSAYTTYDPIVPVGRPEENFPGDPSQVRPGTDMPICMSCHRAHGSPYADILRWDYTTMIAGGGGSGGCFTCHTQKNQTP